MTDDSTKKPFNGMRNITPHLVCAGAADAIAFYKMAFDAVEVHRLATPDGKLMHACLRIGDSHVMLMDEFPDCGACSTVSPKSLHGSPVTIHLYVDNADATFERALKAGATVRMPLEDAFWGDRYGVLVDPFGHYWSIAHPMREVSPEDMQRTINEMCAKG